MATYYSGTFATGMTTINCRLELTVNSQSIANNTSNVTVKAFFWRNNSWQGDTYGTGTCYVKINGTEYSQAITPSQSVKQAGIYLFSKTLNITHNSDGTKTLPLELRATHEMFPVSTKTWSPTLTTIPRASTFTLSSSNVNAGSSTTLTITRASSSFTHKAYLVFGSKTWTIGTSIGTSVAYTIPNETMNQIPSAVKGTGTIRVETYNGSTKLGEKTASITINVPTSVVPSFSSLGVARVDNGVPSGWGIYVQGKSKATLTINSPAGAYGSTITAYSISGGGYSSSASSFTTGVLNTTGTNTFTAKITDSRGRTATATASITVYEYKAPAISSISIVRCDSGGTASDEGTYLKTTASFSVSSCNSKNTATGKTAYKTLTGSYTGEVAITSGTAKVFGAGAISIDSSYKARVTVADAFQTVTKEVDISTASTTMDFRSGGKGVAIGKVSEKNAFEVGMTADFKNRVDFANDTYHTKSIHIADEMGLMNSGGNTYLRNNGTATILSAPNATIHIRPKGNSTATAQTQFYSDGTVELSSASSTGIKLKSELKQSKNVLKLYNGSKSSWIGCQNDNYFHFQTEAPHFYYYQPIIMATPSDGVLLRSETGVQAWNCIDLYRSNYRARLGIGGHASGGYGPTFECWTPNSTSFFSRLDVCTDRLSFYKQGGDKTFNVFVDSAGHGGITIGSTSTTYLKWLRSTAQLQVRNYGDTAYSQIVASSFTNGSKREFKENIKELDPLTAKNIVMGNTIQTYNLKNEVEEMEKIEEEAEALGIVLDTEMTIPNTRAGLILEDLTPEADNILHPERTEGIDVYAMASVLWKHNQEQQKEIDSLRNEIEELKKLVQSIVKEKNE